MCFLRKEMRMRAKHLMRALFENKMQAFKVCFLRKEISMRAYIVNDEKKFSGADCYDVLSWSCFFSKSSPSASILITKSK